MFPDKLLRIGFYHVPNRSKFRHNFRFRTRCFGRVGEIIVKFLGLGGEVRAAFPGIVAHGNDKIKVDVAVFVDVVGRVCGNVDPVLFHNRNSAWVNAMCLHTGAINLGMVSSKMPEIPLGDLASAAVAGA